MLYHEENIPPDDEESQALLTALNTFRNDIKPKGVITTGKHFNVPLLIEAFKLYSQSYRNFGGWNSQKIIYVGAK